jgi:hypothetical protein
MGTNKMKSLKIPKGNADYVGRIRTDNTMSKRERRTDNTMSKRERRTDNTMSKRKRTKGQTTITKTYTSN